MGLLKSALDKWHSLDDIDTMSNIWECLECGWQGPADTVQCPQCKSEQSMNENIKQARKLGDNEGIKGLAPHARVGRICGCRDCFCCAAAQVMDEVNEHAQRLRLAISRAESDRFRFERAGMPEEASALVVAVENTRGLLNSILVGKEDR